MGRTFLFVGIGTVLMLALSVARRKRYDFPLWKSIIIPFMLTVFGVTGAMILAFIESGHFGGISFYGSVLLIPVLLIPTAYLLKIPYGKITDCSVPQICIMLAVMKVGCFVSGCCGGITIAGGTARFPSQIAEMLVAIALAVVIILLDSQGYMENRLYGVYFLTYGILRFGLNFLRDGIKPFVWIIPAGHFWSIISIALGVAWIVICGHMKKRRTLGQSM